MMNKFKLPFGFLRAKEMPGPGKFNIWIAMLGFSLGCIAIIVSISILNGFEDKVKKSKKNDTCISFMTRKKPRLKIWSSIPLKLIKLFKHFFTNTRTGS